MTEETTALIALLRTQPDAMTWPEISSEVLAVGSAIEVWDRHVEPTLLPPPGQISPWDAARTEIAEWTRRELNFVTILSENYPQQLLDIHETPPLLFYRGKLRAHDRGMSVVGSRKVSPRGIRIAKAAAELLISKGLSVIAGLAEGIDTAAHESALDAGGRTVAVIGTGISKYYPEKIDRSRIKSLTGVWYCRSFFPMPAHHDNLSPCETQ